MQNAPVVRLPDEKRPSDPTLIIATVIFLVVALIAVVALARPQLLTDVPEATIHTNPEVLQAERYLELHPAGAAVAGPTNPELSSATFYEEQLATDRFLRENPEIRRYLQSSERQQAAEGVAGPTNPELSSATFYEEQIATDRFLRENPEIRRYIQSQEE